MYAVLGLILLIAGAILVFAVNEAVEGVDLEVLGWILMGGGALALVIAAIRGAGWMSMSSTRLHSERHASSDGRHYVEDVHTE
jgi:hypothetical protein